MKRFYLVALTFAYQFMNPSFAQATEPQWIWGTANAQVSAEDGSCLFRKTFKLDQLPTKAVLQVTCDDQYVLRLNRRLVGVDEHWQDIEQYDVTPALKKGSNELFVNARNLSAGSAGMWLKLTLQFADQSETIVASDDTWEVSLQKAGTWNPDVAKRKNWQTAQTLGTLAEADAWKTKTQFDNNISAISPSSRANEEFSLVEGDRVLFLGNTVIEREQRYGYWEAALTNHFPDQNVIFRNLGWSGDTVFGEARARFGSQSEGFGHLEVHVHAVKPTVIICNYGANAAFRGPSGLDHFETGYHTLLDSLESTGALIILMAPLQHEPLDGKYLSPKFNQHREVYAAKIQEIAKKRNCLFVDMSQEGLSNLTDNGVHLNEYGYWRTASRFLESLGLSARKDASVAIDARQQRAESVSASVTDISMSDDTLSFQVTPQQLLLPQPELDSIEPRPPGTVAVSFDSIPTGRYQVNIDGRSLGTFALRDGSTLQADPWMNDAIKLRRQIQKKNELYFHRWRPQNETYLFLFRKHEQGNNAVEIPKFDPLVADVEAEIAKLRKPRTVKYVLTRVKQ